MSIHNFLCDSGMLSRCCHFKLTGTRNICLWVYVCLWFKFDKGLRSNYSHPSGSAWNAFSQLTGAFRNICSSLTGFARDAWLGWNKATSLSTSPSIIISTDLFSLERVQTVNGTFPCRRAEEFFKPFDWEVFHVSVIINSSNNKTLHVRYLHKTLKRLFISGLVSPYRWSQTFLWPPEVCSFSIEAISVTDDIINVSAERVFTLNGGRLRHFKSE